MLRLAGFFLLCILLLGILRQVPLVGEVFRVPLVGFWLTAILLSVLFSKVAASALDRRRVKNLERRLGAVDTPHNQGKLGSLMLAQERHRRARELLERAVAGEPASIEWRYRLGCARLGMRDWAAAIESLASAARDDEEHAYGAVLLRLAEAYTRAGDARRALECLARFERNHGPSPESAFRRGLALKAAGQGSEARAAFGEVARLSEQQARYQRRSSLGWVARAFLARWV